MYYKLSNVAELKKIEDTFGSRFKHPKIYKKNQLVNGLNESLIPIVKQGADEWIHHAIWGLLPEGFKEEWDIFQSQMNTLNIEADKIEKSKWLSKLLTHQRCIIIATGFFTNYIFDGKVYPYHIHLPNMTPFAMAGIYSQLDDGFFTSALITTTFNEELSQIQHLGTHMPFALSSGQKDRWVSNKTSIKQIMNLLNEEPGLGFQADPVAKEFYKNEIRYSGLLDRVNYVNIPLPK
ncbi:SOS response-associated peptidase family protein [Ascidiimonas aurantiaca]|uniref:SOS response-associated peptidase family protein n=1 Tax=Ascidiimonas aurantiaca TaxID=1685432 RepID=UPI0030EF1522